MPPSSNVLLRLLSCLALGLFVLATAACSGRPVALGNEAYIWQRQWTPALGDAVRTSSDVVQGWRVLAAELDGRGQWHLVEPDAAVLLATGKPVTVVVRIEGQLAQWDAADVIDHIQSVLAQWRGRGLRIAGVEIDHDCATSRLPVYARFLSLLRTSLGEPLRLSITVLPTWLDSASLDALLARVDESVLQVHAVQSPRAGLFDPRQAHAWMDAFARHARGPWRVALPAYGTRVSWDGQGRVASIESERPTLVAGDEASELFADPLAMQGFVSALEADAPQRLAGIVWFRVPTEDDARAWSLATWRAVLSRQPLVVSLLAQVRSAPDIALRDLVLINAGNADLPLPSLLRLDATCGNADGIHGYALQRTPHGLFLQRAQRGVLRAGRQLSVGWLRCDGGAALRVESSEP
ncbi:DUF3142 domain-containing protein [Dyella jiangningensis]|uniref:DUF3142 domain-containing protein n=1 Tax=Dyella jiangningensis TaxID=1379159 RepID=UPI001EE08C60|nr:DUF3142 domain-containing protein [Dyella jiangningensis]